jgi:hypothetical protein
MVISSLDRLGNAMIDKEADLEPEDVDEGPHIDENRIANLPRYFDQNGNYKKLTNKSLPEILFVETVRREYHPRPICQSLGT